MKKTLILPAFLFVMGCISISCDAEQDNTAEDLSAGNNDDTSSYCIDNRNTYVWLKTQEEVDNYGAQGCATIQAPLNILGGDDITDLSSLSNLTSVEELIIHTSTALTSLKGLENISTVYGDVRIYSNDVLEDISALDNLHTIHGNLHITHNDKLKDIHLNSLTTIREGLTISNNESLEGISGLNALEGIFADYIYIQENPNLTSINGFNALEFITPVTQNSPLEIQRTTNFFISDNSLLCNYCGFLSSLNSSASEVDFEITDNLYNPNLSNILSDSGCSGCQ